MERPDEPAISHVANVFHCSIQHHSLYSQALLVCVCVCIASKSKGSFDRSVSKQSFDEHIFIFPSTKKMRRSVCRHVMFTEGTRDDDWSTLFPFLRLTSTHRNVLCSHGRGNANIRSLSFSNFFKRSNIRVYRSNYLHVPLFFCLGGPHISFSRDNIKSSGEPVYRLYIRTTNITTYYSR